MNSSPLVNPTGWILPGHAAITPSMSLIELVAVLLGLANIVLIIRRSVWNFPVAIVMVWHRSKGDDGAVVVRRLTPLPYALWIAGSVAAIWAWGAFMGSYTQTSYPYWDASVAMLSVAGQILMARRFVENWHWWIVVNLISIPLYVAKDLNLTAGLYGVFLVLAVGGLIAWRKAEVAE
jgi:nicotinamide mononucleotide transporter